MIWSVLGGIFFGLLGIFLFLRPDLVWKITEEWKSYRADGPSNVYCLSMKVGGAAFAVLGIAMILLPFAS